MNPTLKKISLALFCFHAAMILVAFDALARNPYIDIPGEQERVDRIRKGTIGKWTQRQSQLDRAIEAEEEAYRQRTGQSSIPVTTQNKENLMRRIGARPDEAAFVLERMRAYQNAGESMRKSDDFEREMNQKVRGW